jgi:predicted MFS family arabinose efflux permease
MMCVFTLFWTGLTFLLAAKPYAYSTAQIGLVSLTAIAGAISAQRVGRLFDRGLSLPAIGVGLIVTLAAVIVSAAASGSIIAVLISVAVFSAGMMGVQVLVQTRMLSIDPAARSRLNTLFVVGNFIGGGIGSTLAGALWGFGGWPVLMLAGTIVVAVALVTWLVLRGRLPAD